MQSLSWFESGGCVVEFKCNHCRGLNRRVYRRVQMQSLWWFESEGSIVEFKCNHFRGLNRRGCENELKCNHFRGLRRSGREWRRSSNAITFEV